MTDAGVITVVASIMGGLQVMQTAYLRHLSEKNSCGGARCVQTMGKALLKANLESSIAKLGNMSGREESQP